MIEGGDTQYFTAYREVNCFNPFIHQMAVNASSLFINLLLEQSCLNEKKKKQNAEFKKFFW